MKNILKILTANLLLTGCSTITTGQNQPISLDTHPHSGAKCILRNDKGSWYVTTPGSVVVTRSYSDLIITCTKDNMSGNTTIKSSTKGMAFGNILAGGLIGLAVDMSTGSAYDYPTSTSCLISEDKTIYLPKRQKHFKNS
jgi:uncharacterized protein YceK